LEDFFIYSWNSEGSLGDNLLTIFILKQLFKLADAVTAGKEVVRQHDAKVDGG